MYKETFHQRIKEIRVELGLKQNLVSAETGINQSDISKYESGELEPNIEKLGKLAQFYNVSIDYLLGNTPMKYKEWRPYNDEANRSEKK